MMDESVSSGSEDGDGNLHGVTKLQRLNENDKYSNERSNEAVCSDLLILGLPFNLSEDEMKEYFSKFGQVNFVEVILVLIFLLTSPIKIFAEIIFVI